MDCEKFESTLLDELYDELDEVTSAAAKRHVGGCARCASLLSGLKATRRVAVLPIEPPPADLEDRILAAAKEAQKVVPLGRRVSRAVSWAGSWAMRPQTAMAALFLLMIGSSALLLKGKRSAPTSAMTVSDQGEPVASATTTTLERPAAADKDESLKESKVAAVAPVAAQPPSVLAPGPAPTPASSAYAMGDSLDGLSGRGGGGANAPQGRLHLSKSAPEESSAAKGLASNDRAYEQNAAPIAGAPSRRTYAAPPGAAAPVSPPSPAPPPSPRPTGPSDGPAQKQQVLATTGFDGAMGAYNAGDYATAARLFDSLAASGDLNAALWAARSVREGAGCQQAVTRFDQVSRSGLGTTAGYDATFDAGHCYRLMGQWDAARQRLAALLTVPSYFNKANGELAAMGPKASAKPGGAKASQQQGAGTQQLAPAAPPPVKQKADAL